MPERADYTIAKEVNLGVSWPLGNRHREKRDKEIHSDCCRETGRHIERVRDKTEEIVTCCVSVMFLLLRRARTVRSYGCITFRV